MGKEYKKFLKENKIKDGDKAKKLL